MIMPPVFFDREGIFIQCQTVSVEIFIDRSAGVDGREAIYIRRNDLLKVLNDRLFFRHGMSEGGEYVEGALFLGCKPDDLLDDGVEVIRKGSLIVCRGSHRDKDEIGYGTGKSGMELPRAFSRDIHDNEVIMRGNRIDPVLEDLLLGAGYMME